jgi:beta-phosphoglucomutase-like phosphatase (HAD superfamily)
MPLALATSSGRDDAEHHLRNADLRRFFVAVATRNDVSRGKPHPDLFLKAAADLGVAPQRCLVLEDSHNGVRAAHAAGCLPIMVPDLLEANDEMRSLCLLIARDLHEIRLLLANSLHGDNASQEAGSPS